MTPSTNGLGTRLKPSSPTSTSSPSEAEIVGQRLERLGALEVEDLGVAAGSSRSIRRAGRTCRRAGGTRSCRCCRSARSAPARSARPWRTASNADGDGRTWCRRARSSRRPAASRRPGHWPASAGSRSGGSSSAAMRVQATCSAAATKTALAASAGGTSPSRKRSARASRSVASAVARALRACWAGFRQDAGVDSFQDPRQRHAPALVAPPGRGVERRPMDELRLGDLRCPRQGARRQPRQRLVLGGDQGRDHAQERLRARGPEPVPSAVRRGG